ncbi:MAG: glycerol-3-phosphate dehydrogenase [Porticoccus sp.]|jgi:glycerol-3-phosphate dehydrogenase
MTDSNTGFTDKQELLQKIRSGQSLDWDVIIVGGGITGAGVLRECVRRGYKVLLLEQQDFSWGTSSRSSKMIHGGLRYLAQGDLKLTKQSLLERERLIAEAPGLIERMGYYFVLRKGVFPGRFVFSMLLKFYDFIAGYKNNRYVSNQQLTEEFPGIESHSLHGACYYTDAVTDDARLVLRLLQESIAKGGNAISYTKVNELVINDGHVSGVKIQDTTSDECFELNAPVVINATGAWADKLRNQLNPEKRVRPLRGSHLVLPKAKLPVADAIALFHPVDKRGVFIFPWEGCTVIGTTDVDHSDDLDIEASITAQEINYLLEVIKVSFPHSKIASTDAISTWAGVRPVIGSENAKDPSKERRDHAVWDDSGLVTVSGGKLTTFRIIALDALAAADNKLPNSVPSDNDRVFDQLDNNIALPSTIDNTRVKRLLGRYGNLCREVFSDGNDTEHQTLSTSEYSLAECRWAIKCEAVIHLDDLMLRRTRLGSVLANAGEELFAQLQPLFEQELGWDQPKWDDELARYIAIWRSYYSIPKG